MVMVVAGTEAELELERNVLQAAGGLRMHIEFDLEVALSSCTQRLLFVVPCCT